MQENQSESLYNGKSDLGYERLFFEHPLLNHQRDDQISSDQNPDTLFQSQNQVEKYFGILAKTDRKTMLKASKITIITE